MQHVQPGYAAQSVQKSSWSCRCTLTAWRTQAAPRHPQQQVARHPTIGDGDVGFPFFEISASVKYWTMARPRLPQQKINRHGPIALVHWQNPVFQVSDILFIMSLSM